MRERGDGASSKETTMTYCVELPISKLTFVISRLPHAGQSTGTALRPNAGMVWIAGIVTAVEPFLAVAAFESAVWALVASAFVALVSADSEGTLLLSSGRVRAVRIGTS